jgi:hypothetical protein
MATNFLYAPGTHGFIVAPPVTVMTTELNTLANGNSAVSSVGGTSGVFTQTTFGNCVWAEIELVAGGAFTPGAGGYIAGWWLFSEAGATFEKTVSNIDLARSPDLTIPLFMPPVTLPRHRASSDCLPMTPNCSSSITLVLRWRQAATSSRWVRSPSSIKKG